MQPLKKLGFLADVGLTGSTSRLAGRCVFFPSQCTSVLQILRDFVESRWLDQPVTGLAIIGPSAGSKNTLRCRNRQWEQDLHLRCNWGALGGCDGDGMYCTVCSVKAIESRARKAETTQ